MGGHCPEKIGVKSGTRRGENNGGSRGEGCNRKDWKREKERKLREREQKGKQGHKVYRARFHKGR